MSETEKTAFPLTSRWTNSAATLSQLTRLILLFPVHYELLLLVLLLMGLGSALPCGLLEGSCGFDGNTQGYCKALSKIPCPAFRVHMFPLISYKHTANVDVPFSQESSCLSLSCRCGNMGNIALKDSTQTRQVLHVAPTDAYPIVFPSA